MHFVLYMRRSGEILILNEEGITEKSFLWESRLWVGRRKGPILGYIPKNDKKMNAFKG